jgi:DNA ligase-1
MNRFAELLDRLAYEPGRNNKLRLIVNYFREVEDPDRGYALAALTGALSFKHAKPGLIRDLIAARTDPVLFALSYDYVGDLSETVALMWPALESAPSPACGGGLGSGPMRAQYQRRPLSVSPPQAGERTLKLRPRSWCLTSAEAPYPPHGSRRSTAARPRW